MIPLKELCLRVIYCHCNILSSSVLQLPGELMDNVFLTLAKLTVLSDAHLYLWKNSQSKEFDFSACKQVTDGGIKRFVQQYPMIESLKLCESGVSSSCLSSIAEHCSNLKLLDISELPLKEGDFILLKKCTSLQVLVCRKCTGLKSKTIGKLLSQCTSI